MDTADNFDVNGSLDDHLGSFDLKYLLMLMQMEVDLQEVNSTLASARLVEW